MTWESDEVCNVGEDIVESYKFVVEIYCDEAFIEPATPNPDTIVASNTDTCSPTVSMDHVTGCPVYTPAWIITFIENNLWAAGIVLCTCGVLIGLKGKPYFNGITAGLAATFVFQILFVAMVKTH